MINIRTLISSVSDYIYLNKYRKNLNKNHIKETKSSNLYLEMTHGHSKNKKIHVYIYIYISTGKQIFLMPAWQLRKGKLKGGKLTIRKPQTDINQIMPNAMFNS